MSTLDQDAGITTIQRGLVAGWRQEWAARLTCPQASDRRITTEVDFASQWSILDTEFEHDVLVTAPTFLDSEATTRFREIMARPAVELPEPPAIGGVEGSNS